MSTYETMSGYYIKLKDKTEAVRIYQKLGFNIEDNEDEDEFRENFYELCYGNDKLKVWKPFTDYNTQFGLVYLEVSDYDTQDICIKFINVPKPPFAGLSVVPFAVNWYNGSDMPFVME